MIIVLDWKEFKKVRDNIRDNNGGLLPQGFYKMEDKVYDMRFSVYNDTYKCVIDLDNYYDNKTKQEIIDETINGINTHFINEEFFENEYLKGFIKIIDFE